MRLSLVATVLAVMLVSACTSSHSTSPGGLVVTASVAPSTLRLGEPTTVTVTAINLGSRTVTISANTCPDPFVVLTQTGEVVGPGYQVCTAAAIFRKLAPGERYVFTQQWSGGARVASGDAPGALPAGTYLLRGRVSHDGGVAESQAVTIKIMPSSGLGID